MEKCKKMHKSEKKGVQSAQSVVECIHKIKIDGELYYGFKLCSESFSTELSFRIPW